MKMRMDDEATTPLTSTDAAQLQVGSELLLHSCETLRRLRAVRGRSRRTERRIARAMAALALALGLLGVAPLADRSEALMEPMFAASSANPFGFADAGDQSYPEFVDLDDDGDLDAVVGIFVGTQWQYFENTGSSGAPAFAAAVGNPFGLTNGSSRATPALADLDNDGDVDFVTGGDDGNLRYFQNTGSAAAPAFAASVSNPFGLTNAGVGSWPEFADLDDDGDFDLLVGEISDLIYYENTGTAAAPAFAASVANPFGLAAASAGQRSQPELADLDGDGDLDAWVGGTADTRFFENTGSTALPAFAAAVTNPFGLVGVGGAAVPAFADLDDDGDLDGYFGQSAGNIVYFQNDCPMPTPSSTPTETPTATATATSTSTATATPRLPDGAACTDPNDCTSGNCVDDVCCDTACDGPLEQCNLPGQQGQCAATAAPAPALAPLGLLAGLAALVGVAWRVRRRGA